jgi:hypothetical protein
MRRWLCLLIGHQYRNSVPRLCECLVYCPRCQRVFGHFDSPDIRRFIERHGGMVQVMAALHGEPR